MVSPQQSFSKFLNTRKLHPVALENQDEQVRVFFVADDMQFDITDHHALISLKPFAIAVNRAVARHSSSGKQVLRIQQREKILGELKLKHQADQQFEGLTISLYVAELSRNSMSYTDQFWNTLLLVIKNKTNRKSRNFVVPPAELLKLFVYSLKPRPVFLVSVTHKNGFDIFPVDILGKISEAHILFGIRTSSPAVSFILSEKKVCVSSVPFDKRTQVYQFGKHHPGGVLPENFGNVNFIRSEKFSIPVPDFAITVQELMIENTISFGAHTQFIARIENQYSQSAGFPLAHTPWFNPNYFKHRFDVSK